MRRHHQRLSQLNPPSLVMHRAQQPHVLCALAKGYLFVHPTYAVFCQRSQRPRCGLEVLGESRVLLQRPRMNHQPDSHRFENTALTSCWSVARNRIVLRSHTHALPSVPPVTATPGPASEPPMSIKVTASTLSPWV